MILNFTDNEIEVLTDYLTRKAMRLEESGLQDSKCCLAMNSILLKICKEKRNSASLSPSSMRDVQTLIRLFQKAVGESDIQILAALINEEADIRTGKTNLPMTYKLAHELIDLAERVLNVLDSQQHVDAESIAKGERNDTRKESSK